MNTPTLHSHQLDENTYVFVLELFSHHIVELQAMLELYEGLATMRTIRARDSIVGLIVSPSMKPHCEEALIALHEQLQWRSIEHPDPADLKVFNDGDDT